jgi:hypothetical protein
MVKRDSLKRYNVEALKRSAEFTREPPDRKRYAYNRVILSGAKDLTQADWAGAISFECRKLRARGPSLRSG